MPSDHARAYRVTTAMGVPTLSGPVPAGNTC